MDGSADDADGSMRLDTGIPAADHRDAGTGVPAELPDLHADTDAHRNVNADRDAKCDPDADSYIYANEHPHFDTDTDSHAYPDTHQHSYRHPD